MRNWWMNWKRRFAGICNNYAPTPKGLRRAYPPVRGVLPPPVVVIGMSHVHVYDADHTRQASPAVSWTEERSPTSPAFRRASQKDAQPNLPVLKGRNGLALKGRVYKARGNAPGKAPRKIHALKGQFKITQNNKGNKPCPDF